MKAHIRLCVSLQLVILLLSPGRDAAAQNDIVLTPSKDNTLYESPTGALSNGAGTHVFAGKNFGNEVRRALLVFPVAATVPAGVTIDSVKLTLHMSRTISGVRTIDVHRVLKAWGEGSSFALGEEGQGHPATVGDATWLHTFFDSSLWQNAGGDFDPTASTSTDVDQEGTYNWKSTPQLVDDVQGWLEIPSENFGWLLLGDEDEQSTTKRFDSRENPNPDFTPKLHVYYSTATAVEYEIARRSVRLLQNYPNPFRKTTTVTYELYAPQFVTLNIFDTLGRLVATPVALWQNSGPHEVVYRATGLSPGIYVYQIIGSGSRQSGTMIAVK
ncbi:MAG: hypothetical protein BMS9Abin05_0019 [Rhodothermia bacterium]|nr:MAG: hypothetical protein BMS9Abin05_0019 [Rhodothermia bacterium]